LSFMFKPVLFGQDCMILFGMSGRNGAAAAGSPLYRVAMCQCRRSKQSVNDAALSCFAALHPHHQHQPCSSAHPATANGSAVRPDAAGL